MTKAGYVYSYTRESSTVHAVDLSQHRERTGFQGRVVSVSDKSYCGTYVQMFAGVEFEKLPVGYDQCKRCVKSLAKISSGV